VQKALVPAPVNTIAAIDLSHPALLKALISSSQVWPRNALYLSGRLMVIQAAGPRTS
jgi:hypothetical protein